MLPNFRWDLVLSVHQLEPNAHTAKDEVGDANPHAGASSTAPKLGVRMLGARKIAAIALSSLTWVYSLMVLVLTTALWVRVVSFRGFRNAPAENIAFGAYFIMPVAILIRGWYCFAYRKDHERYVWDLIDQEEAEMQVMHQAEQLHADPWKSTSSLDDRSQNNGESFAGSSTLPPPQELGIANTSNRMDQRQQILQFPEMSKAAGKIPDEQPRARPVDMMRAVTMRQERPGLHHSRQRFLSVGWRTMDRRWSFFSFTLTLLVWAALNAHLFRPLFTGIAPSEIDWMLQVPPDGTDNALLNVSVSGYCCVLMIGSFLQLGIIATAHNVHCLFAALLMIRAERLRRRVKQLTQARPDLASIWGKYVGNWHAKLRQSVGAVIYDPVATRGLWLQFLSFCMFSSIFGGLLLYNGGASPRVPIFLITCMHMCWFALFVAVNDKRRSLQHLTAQSLGMFSNESASANESASDGQLASGTVKSGVFRHNSSRRASGSGATNLFATSALLPVPAAVSSAPSFVKQPDDHESASAQDEKMQNPAMTRQNSIYHPVAMTRRLLPNLVLQALAISLLWIGWMCLRAWVNFLECTRSAENAGFLEFSYERCSTNDFTQICIESAFTSYVRITLLLVWSDMIRSALIFVGVLSCL